jgi:hypothetical protein
VRRTRRTRAQSLNLVVRPLTPDLWPALESLFGPRGACNGWWCMYWRIGPEYRTRDRARNKAALRAIVEAGPPPGLIAFDGALPVGWCPITFLRAGFTEVARHEPPRPIVRKTLR